MIKQLDVLNHQAITERDLRELRASPHTCLYLFVSFTKHKESALII